MNSVLITRAPNLVDVVTPFLIGVLGFAQFAVTVPLPASAGHTLAGSPTGPPHWWLLVAGAEWAVLVAHLKTTKTQLELTQAEAPPDVVPLLAWCKNLVRRAAIGALSTTVTLLIVFLLLRFGPPDACVGSRPRTFSGGGNWLWASPPSPGSPDPGYCWARRK